MLHMCTVTPLLVEMNKEEKQRRKKTGQRMFVSVTGPSLDLCHIFGCEIKIAESKTKSKSDDEQTQREKRDDTCLFWC